MTPRTFGARVALLRGRRPKAEIARACGVDVRTVYRWEHDTNETGDLGSKRLLLLADTLGVSVLWLLTGEGEAPVLPTGESEEPSGSVALPATGTDG